MGTINKQALLPFLRAQFRIDWNGHHGIAHWARVRVNSLLIAKEIGGNPHVVELFSFSHDARRLNEHIDDGHGLICTRVQWWAGAWEKVCKRAWCWML